MDSQVGSFRAAPPAVSMSLSTSQQLQPPLPQLSMPPPIYSGGLAMTNTTNTMHTTSTCIEKIFIGLDHAPPSFDLRSRLIGTGGANLNYIRTETGAMATLRGRGSLFVDPMLSMESPEPIHLYIEHLRYEGLQAAKQLARNLIETLQQELVQFQQMNNPPMSGVHYSAQTTVVQQPHIYTQHTMSQPPPPMLSLPPPITAIPHPALQHPPPQPQAQAQAAQQPQPPATTILQTHQLQPLQMHPPTQALVHIQPPALPIPIKTIVPAGNAVATAPPAPPPPHLSQPPPSLAHLQHPPTQTQIVVNQALPIPIKTMVQATSQPQSYQYIQHTTGQEATAVAQPVATGPSAGAITIQHIYQSSHPSMPPQHVQSIVQGNAAAYMVPPPNLIQTTTQVPTSTIIYSTHPPPQPGTVNCGEIKLEESKEELLAGKLEEYAAEVARTMAQTQMVSSMTAPPPIMSVPPPAVHHLMANTFSQPPGQSHLYGQVTMSHAPPVGGQQQQQHFVIGSNGWTSQAHTVHQQAVAAGTAMHQQQQPPPIEYRPGMGGTTYQQIQHPIMTATTSMGMPVVQYQSQQPQMIKMNHQVPPPPVPFPMVPISSQEQAAVTNMMRTGQKRKMVDEGGVNGMPNMMKNGHG